jgi:hypothetical protein
MIFFRNAFCLKGIFLFIFYGQGKLIPETTKSLWFFYKFTNLKQNYFFAKDLLVYGKRNPHVINEMRLNRFN